MELLDQYLDGLAKESSVKQERRQHLETMDIQDLARVAGVKLAMTKCSKCGSDMHKEGSMMKCSCGMMKSAAVNEKKDTNWGAVAGMPVATGLGGAAIGGLMGGFSGGPKGFGPGAIKGGLLGTAVGAGVSALIGIGKLLQKADPSGETLNTVIKLAPAAATVAATSMAMKGGNEEWGKTSSALPQEIVGTSLALLEENGGDFAKTAAVLDAVGVVAPRGSMVYMAKEASQVKQAEEEGIKLAHEAARAYVAFEGDLEKVAYYLGEQGIEKEAVMPLLRALGRSGLNVGKNLARGNWDVAGKALSAMPKAIGRGASESWKGISSMPQLYGKARAAGQGRASSLWESMKNPAFMGAGGRRALKAKSLAAAKGSAPAAAPAAAVKTSAADVGDAAGRLLAKMSAATLPMDELRESIEEARAREDIPGRARRWQVGGGIGGGLAGMGAGAGLGALGGRLGSLGGGKGALIGGALGAIPGAAAGQYFGKRHGAEEAAADKAISMLRSMRAHRIGMTSGARAGAQAGYMAGVRRGMAAGGEPKMAGIAPTGLATAGLGALSGALEGDKRGRTGAGAGVGALGGLGGGALGSVGGGLGGAFIGALPGIIARNPEMMAAGAGIGAGTGALGGGLYGGWKGGRWAARQLKPAAETGA